MLRKQFVGCLEGIREGDKWAFTICESNEDLLESLSYAKSNAFLWAKNYGIFIIALLIFLTILN